MQGSGPFLITEGEIFLQRKLTVSIKKRSPCNLSDVQRLHKILNKQVHLSDVPHVHHQPKNTSKLFPEEPLMFWFHLSDIPRVLMVL